MRIYTVFASGAAAKQIFKLMSIGFAGLFTYSVANAQLTGSYTINSGQPTGSGNFNSFGAFVSALAAAGNSISGAVTVTVATNSGPYNEQIILPAISGAGPGPGGTRIGITIRGNGNTLYYAGGLTENATITMNGTDYMTFQNLTIKRGSTGTYQYGVRMYNAATNNRFDSCFFDMGTTYTTSNWVGLLASSSNTSVSSGQGCFSNLDIWNSKFTGGYYGIRVYSSASNLNVGMNITNTKFSDVYYYGTYFYYGVRDLVVTKCTYEKPNYLNSGLGYSNYFYYCNNITFTKNTISAYPYGNYFYFVNYSGALATDKAIIVNNFYAPNNHSTTYAYGIFAYYTTNLQAYYNSVNLNGLNTSYSYAYPMYIYYCTNPDVRNNVFAMNCSSYFYAYFYSPSGTITYNYNTFWLYQTPPTQYWYYGTTLYSTWQAMATATGTNANSQQKDPSFVSKTDLHITGADLYQKGVAITGFTDDIDGTVRPTPPSHGAHEFIPPAYDASVVTFIQPVAQCADTNQIIVKVKNFGTNALDSVRVYWSWTGNTGSGSGMKFLQFNPALPTGKDTNLHQRCCHDFRCSRL